MTAEKLIIAALACWRITSLLLVEDGPLSIFVHTRTLARRYSVFDGALACFWCGSVWVAFAVTLIVLTDYWLVLAPFALSAIAIWMSERVHLRD
jgi:hypothetical protein